MVRDVLLPLTRAAPSGWRTPRSGSEAGSWCSVSGRQRISDGAWSDSTAVTDSCCGSVPCVRHSLRAAVVWVVGFLPSLAEGGWHQGPGVHVLANMFAYIRETFCKLLHIISARGCSCSVSLVNSGWFSWLYWGQSYKMSFVSYSFICFVYLMWWSFYLCEVVESPADFSVTPC